MRRKSGYVKWEHKRNGEILDKLKIKQTSVRLHSELSEEMGVTEEQNEYRKNSKPRGQRSIGRPMKIWEGNC